MTVNVGHGSNPSFETVAAAIQELQAGQGGAASAVGSPFISNFGPTTITIPATLFGAKFDNVTDDSAAIQAALDAATFAVYSLSGNDKPACVVQLPAGRAKIGTPLKLHANVVLQGQGSSSTYLVSTFATADTALIQLATGAEVMCTVRDLGIILSGAVNGIDFTFTGGASILGDSNHQVSNVVIVGGRRALFVSNGNTENRIDNLRAYRQTPNLGNAVIYIGGTDHMLSRITVAQPQYDNSGQGGAGIRLGVSNTRIVNCKVFGGSATVSGSMQAGIYVIGQRNQLIGCEVQDYAGGVGVEDDQGHNSYLGCVIDSCQAGGFYASGPVIVRGMHIVSRAGGAFTMPNALQIPTGAGADVDALVSGVTNVFSSGGSATAGSRFRLNGEGGATSVAYAATITPDAYAATLYLVGTLTGAITLANPTSSFGNAYHVGQRIAFLLTQDATGGHTISFGTSYKTTGAIPTTASSVTRIEFEYDGTNWRETARTNT